MILPEIDPIIFQIGPIAVRWYGLTWLAAFYTIYILIKRYQKDLNEDQVNDLMFYSLLGAIIGGRAGYVFFYSIEQFCIIKRPSISKRNTCIYSNNYKI